jgi:hypothetical protein
MALPTVAVAQPAGEAPGTVKAFNSICLSGGLEPAARPASLAAAGWIKAPATTIDARNLMFSRTIELNFDFSTPETQEEWSSTIDGKRAKVILATFPAKRRYPNLCALIIDDISNAMPYSDDLKAAFKAFGIGGKSVDLVHYFEYAGKVGAEKHPVRGEIFSRSQVSGHPKSMHIYVAY